MTARRFSRHLPAFLAVAIAAALAAGPAHAAAGPATLVVPDVRGQAFVFAKGMLDDAGFAWRVSGPVHGYAADTVVSQSPSPGARVIDTGAPTVLLRLARNAAYKELGRPQDRAPFPGTPIRLTGATKPASAAKAPTKPVASAVRKPVQKPAAKPLSWPARRPPAFAVPGAKREPLDEMPLPQRAALLRTWLAAHPRPTRADAGYYDYQHAWLVAGARFGWWHGAEALRTLIEVDRQAERRWGMGPGNEQVARAALAEVERRSR